MFDIPKVSELATSFISFKTKELIYLYMLEMHAYNKQNLRPD